MKQLAGRADLCEQLEARGDETMPAEMRGIDAIRGKNEWWFENNGLHSASVDGPMVTGDRFTVISTSPSRRRTRASALG